MITLEHDTGEGYCAPSGTGTPAPLSSTTVLCKSVEIFARKHGRTANTGDIYVGFAATNDSQQRQLTPGQSLSIDAAEGEQLDLSTIYVDITSAGDEACYVYVN